MKEYRIKGLTCENCTREMEEKIQKLEGGDTAVLNYNTGQLRIDPEVDLQKVHRILHSEGASLEASEHSREQGKKKSWHWTETKSLLIISSLLFLLALLLENRGPGWIVILLYLAPMVLSGFPTFVKGLKNLLRFKFTIDTLMTIALIGAVSIGQWKEASLVAILFGVNELLEGMGMEKARRSVEALLKIAPMEALLINDGKEKIVTISSLQVGDTVLVKAGGQIPSDGTVVAGKSSVNESAITGESLPIEKVVGSSVFGGSLNNEGVLKIKIEKAYEDSSLAKILHLVREAQATKTPTELFINRFARFYTPAIIMIALLVMLIPPLFFQGDWNTYLYQGLAVLIVGCPCALILSSPIAIISGITRNAKNGILIKGGVFLEELGKIDTLVFDKTGTLTKGHPSVDKVVVYDPLRFYTIAASMENKSSHPIARAIMKEIGNKDVEIQEPEEITTLSGHGIMAIIKGLTYRVGNESSISHLPLAEEAQKVIEELKNKGQTLVLVADEKNLLGMFGLSDEIREESKDVVSSLHKMGIRRTVMLTGDHHVTAERVAAKVGVTDFYGDLLPEAKATAIEELKNHGKVAMIGDGINDAPALAMANLGIAMGKGTDSAIETADIVLMQDHLGKLPQAISISKKVNRIIKLNIFLALTLKIVALLLTIPGWLTLWIAILSDMGATILVTLISLTILLEKGKK